jgi:FlaA1/EpsC-like NDP-sugar epimerase
MCRKHRSDDEAASRNQRERKKGSVMFHPRQIKQIGKFAVDAAILGVAFCGAFLLRFEGSLPGVYGDAMLIYLPIVLGVKLLALTAAGRRRSPWRFINLRETVCIFLRLTCVAAALLMWAIGHAALPFLWARQEALTLPIGVIVLDFCLGFAGVIGVRACTRLLFERTEKRALGKTAGERVPTLLFGAGRAGALVAKEILARPDCGLDLVGFLDDDENLRGMNVESLPVLGGAADLTRIAQRFAVRQVIITIAHAQEKAAPRIALLCETNGLRTKIIPPLHEIVEGKINLSKIREVSIEDLLRRSPIRLDIGEVEKIVKGQIVLVTGAGGSIGSELCRVIARLQPATLVLVEQAENSLFHIHGALVEAWPNLHIVPSIADICDEERMDGIFAAWRPSLVFHAAAHKHVPMMEWNPGEAVKNNVLGTKAIAMLADTWQVERFVMISTDKAVNPTSVMGVSKRVAELFIQSFAQKSGTRFMTVRFGNVLGSAGSVIPTFQRQIACGGPVTVTHPEMRRYFMTIPEACQLVLQAGAMGKGGELFILDMGEPVKIYDLACDLIRLSGLTPHHDIEIRITGLRPGEKLYEELSLGEEDVLKTTHPRIFVGKVKAPRLHWITDSIDELEELARGPDASRIFAKLKEIVPEYQTTVVREDAKAEAPLRGPHEQGAPACSS